jgi:hypothetical protein
MKGNKRDLRENKLIFLGKMEIPWKNEVPKLALMGDNQGESSTGNHVACKDRFLEALPARIVCR